MPDENENMTTDLTTVNPSPITPQSKEEVQEKIEFLTIAVISIAVAFLFFCIFVIICFLKVRKSWRKKKLRKTSTQGEQIE